MRGIAVSAALLLFGLASAASAVTIDWVPIGDPANPADTNRGGAVAYAYNIDEFEVTNAQYAEFLNAKAASDPLALYNMSMGSGFGGITRSGSPGTYSYSVITGRGDMPVNYVSFYDALRFANWLNNGQGSGDTETGAYTLLGGTVAPSNGATVTRNAGATIFLTSENEWYKAAFYSPSTSVYYNYPTGSDTRPTCSTPNDLANQANCNTRVGDLTSKGSYTGSASPYGTFDQGGNVMEWNEAIAGRLSRGVRGGSFLDDGSFISAPNSRTSTGEDQLTGFRVASIPEPGTGLLLMAGLLGLAQRRRSDA